MARSTANQALRDKERAVHERGIQEQKAAFLEAEVSRTSTALQEESHSNASKVCIVALKQLYIVLQLRAVSVRTNVHYVPNPITLLDNWSHTARWPQIEVIASIAAQLRELQVKLNSAEATAAEKEADASRAAERVESQEAAAADLLQELKQTKQDAAEMREALERELETTSRLVGHQLTCSLAAAVGSAVADPSLSVGLASAPL